MADKERMNMVITGHVDHGKSTSFGHMLFLLGQIHDPKKKRAPWRIAERYYMDSKKEQMGSWSYAWILDPLIEERSRGLTINISFTEFQTDKYIYNLIDAPGHSDFIKNMITGASQADCAILVVSARKGEFEDGVKRAGTATGKYANVIGMTTEHMLLLTSLGVQNIVVCINKMDTVKWDKERYETIKKQLAQMFLMLMKHVRVDNPEDLASKISYVPTSGLIGVNLLPKDKTLTNIENHITQADAAKADEKFIESLKKEKVEIESTWPDWYDGPSIYDALDNFPSPSEKKDELSKKALRIPVQSVLNISGVGNVFTGRVASGKLLPNTDVMVAPTKMSNEPISITVKTIQEFHKEIPQALPGDNIGFNVKAKNLGAKDIIRGAVISSKDNPAKPLLPGKDGFLAMVLIVRSLGKKSKAGEKEWGVHVNYSPVVHCGTAQVTCRVTEIKTLDGAEVDTLKQNQRGMVWFTPVQPIVIESVANSPSLGRFALRDSGKTVAVGIVEKVEYGKYT
ncbi:MAG: GTP-binding protein [Candidatus Hodarchaeales archaeon]|jgi:elongation factor 1-alpha